MSDHLENNLIKCSKECMSEKNELRQLVQRGLVQILDLNKECWDLQKEVEELKG